MKYSYKVIIFSALSFFGAVQADFFSIESDREFDRKMKEYHYTHVCFANPELHGPGVEDALRSVSKHGSYGSSLQNYVGFIFGNTAYDGVANLASSYGGSQPFCMLFRGYDDHSYEPVKGSMVTGDLSRSAMLSHMSKHLGSEIDDLQEEIEDAKEEADQERASKRRRVSDGPRVSFGLGVGSPYYYDDYYGYGPWRRGYYGRPWGRRHYRRGYYGRPGFHFGVST